MNMRCALFYFMLFLSGAALFASAILSTASPLQADEADVMTVRQAEGKLYAQPVKIAPVIESLRKGAQVLVLRQKGEWYAVSLADQRLGWAHQSIFTPEAAAAAETAAAPNHAPTPKTAAANAAGQSAVLKVPSGRVRSAPSFDAPLAFGLREGERFTVVTKQGDWYHIKSTGGKPGWIYKTLVQLSAPSPPEAATPKPVEAHPPAAPAAVSSETETAAPPAEKRLVVSLKVSSGRVRTGPSKASPKAFSIRRGTRAEVTETDGGWYHILLPDGRKGWSYKKMFDIVGKKEVTAPSAQKKSTAPKPGAAASEKKEQQKASDTLDPAKASNTADPLKVAGKKKSGVEKEIRAIRFEAPPEGDESIIFDLSSFNPPKTYTVNGKEGPMVVCEFTDTRLSPDIGNTIPVNGKLITGLTVQKPSDQDAVIRVEASLDPRYEYSVDQMFFKKNNRYIMTFKK